MKPLDKLYTSVIVCLHDGPDVLCKKIRNRYEVNRIFNLLVKIHQACYSFVYFCPDFDEMHILSIRLKENISELSKYASKYNHEELIEIVNNINEVIDFMGTDDISFFKRIDDFYDSTLYSITGS